MNHPSDQGSFLREQIKSKNQQIHSLLEHTSGRDNTYTFQKKKKKGSLLAANLKWNEIRPGTNSIYNTNANAKKEP